MSTFLRRSAVAVAAGLLAGAACTVHKSETPALTGPSEFGLSIVVTAIPDSINQDGASQSAIVVTVHDASGQPKAGASLRADIFVGGVIQDFGQLSARTLVTGADGKASAIYTAPAAVPGAGISVVSILVTPIGTDFQAAAPQIVAIRLSPPGVIVPVIGAPLPKFVVAPIAPNAKSPATFDGTTSCGSTDASGACTTSSKIVTYAWDFGDGSTATGAVVSHAFALQQTYSVALTVTNDRGVSATSRQNVVVGPGLVPTANFTFSPTAPNVGDTVYFDASSSTPGAGHTIASYAWTSGDGTVGSGIAPSYKFLKPGTFTVSLKVTDEAGQSSVTSKSVIVSNAAATLPTANFTFSPTGPVQNQTVFFNASSSTAGTGRTLASYAWDFGDNNSAVGVTASRAYATVGTFTVTLKVTDDAGQSAVTSKTVTVASAASTPPTAVFTFSPVSPGINENVFFNGSTSTAGAGRTIASYNWTFGDGTTATGVTPAGKAYATAGTYAVQLKVTDDVGQTNTSAAQNVIVGNPPTPTAKFTFSPTDPGANQQVIFDGSTSTTAQGQTITDYAWNLGDGTPIVHTTNKTIAHSFATANTFTVSLTVTDSAGRTNATSATVKVGAQLIANAAFTFTPAVGIANQAMNFDGSTSTPSAGAAAIVSWTWNFGDSTTLVNNAIATQAHTYTTAGTYNVTLTVTDNLGRTGTISKTLVVQ